MTIALRLPDDPTAAQVATAVRSELTTELGRIDVAVSTRATSAEATGDTAGTTTLLARLTATRAGLLDTLSLLDVAISTRATPADVSVTVAQPPTIEVTG